MDTSTKLLNYRTSANRKRFSKSAGNNCCKIDTQFKAVRKRTDINIHALTESISETGAYRDPSESQNSTVLGQGGLSPNVQTLASAG